MGMNLIDVLVNNEIVKATENEIAVLKKFSVIKERVRLLSTINNIQLAQRIEVKHRISSKEEIEDLINILKDDTDIELKLTTVHVSALNAFNNMVNERRVAEGYVTKSDESRIMSLIERVYNTPISTTVLLSNNDEVYENINRSGVEWVVHGRFTERGQNKKAKARLDRLKSIIKETNLTVVDATYKKNIYVVTAI